MKEDLIATLDRVAQETFAYFDGAGRSTSARVDRWQARDVLRAARPTSAARASSGRTATP
jgi:hypothetical protein